MLETFVALGHLIVFPGGLFAILFGLFLKGLDRKAEARLQRRVGPPLMQPFFDVAKLCTKEVLIPNTAHRTAFMAAPVAAFAAMLVCASLLPVPGLTEGLPRAGDLLVIFYVLPISAMALMLGGSSSSSPYGGIGFAREMLLMLAYELPLLMVILAVALKVGQASGTGVEFSLTRIVDYQLANGSLGLHWSTLPALLAWLVFIPGTMGVPPFDVPEAETEILEGPLLEYSGPLLALFHLASAVKMVVVLALGVLLFFPGLVADHGLPNLVWFLAKCTLFGLVTVTCVKAATGRLRMEQVLRFFMRYPTALASLSLLLVWLGF